MSIKGIPVGTTTPRPDWNQEDPTKADYIKNKPDFDKTITEFGSLLTEVGGVAYDNQREIQRHVNNEDGDNPHGVTCEQIGAITHEDAQSLVDTKPSMEAVANEVQYALDTAGLNGHAYDYENPHQVTAEQVGAVTKDQHDDDIADVTQQLYDTRLEFEERIELEVKQIQSSLDSLDASQIGAAPAGYGLGETSAKANNWNAGYWNMFARSNQNSPDGKWWYGLVCREQTNTGTTTEIAFSVDAGSTVLEARRSRNAGSNWGEWEYVNPPMLDGVEYRTTERYNGKAVYAKLTEIEYDGLHPIEQEIASGVSCVVDARVTKHEGDNISNIVTTGWYLHSYGGGNLVFNSDYSTNSPTTFIVLAKYTKE